MLVKSANDFFEERLNQYFDNNHINIDKDSKNYLISVLSKFVSQNEIKHTTLFDIYKDCVEKQELGNYQYLGDHSLYIAGVFPTSLSRSLVGVDYYVQMGQMGYANASALSYSSQNRLLYQSLADNFKTYLNSFYYISKDSLFKDTLSLYDNYFLTQNPEVFKDLYLKKK